MIFTIKRHSNLRFEEKRNIASLEDLVALTAEFGCELRLCPVQLFDKHPVIWLCDPVELPRITG